MVDGKLCGYIYDFYYGYVYGAWYAEFDYLSGEELYSEEL